MKNILIWIAFNVPLGKLNPYILGLALGAKSNRVKDGEQE